MTHRILLVDDNEDDQFLVQRALRKFSTDVSVDVAADGQAALDYLQSHEEALPDLVLLDLKLPKLSGIDVLHRARNEMGLRELPIVLFTCSDEESDKAAATRCGATEYAQKPTDGATHASMVRRLVSTHVGLPLAA